ncbi:MAG: hypothetical protein Q7K65_05095 [Candidatus Buchananbacteria bacterium]|nr:hypothetical protein [Candidatus Buchananbacteria bacterium]
MEENKIYKPILKKAWAITWKFKSLWFLGFFAALISSGGEFELLSRIISDPASNQSFIREMINSFQTGIQDNLPAGGNLWSNLWSVISSAPTSLVTAVLVILITIIIALFVLWLMIVSQIGLIKNIDSAKENKMSTINEGIDAGVEKFWPILIINIVYKIILLVIFLVLGKEILLLITLGTLGSVIHVVSLVLFSIIVVIISFLIRYQILYIVLRKEKILSALKSAWKLFLGNWLISLEMAFILFIVYMVVFYLATFLTAVLLAVPLIFVTYSSQIPALVLMILVLTSVLAIVIMTLLVTALLSVFQWSSWVILFNQINTNKTLSKIARLSAKSPNIPNIFKKK